MNIIKKNINFMIALFLGIIFIFSQSLQKITGMNSLQFQASTWALLPALTFLISEDGPLKYLFSFITFLFSSFLIHYLLTDPYYLQHPFYSFHLKSSLFILFLSLLTMQSKNVQKDFYRFGCVCALYSMIYMIFQFVFGHATSIAWENYNIFIFLILSICLFDDRFSAKLPQVFQKEEPLKFIQHALIFILFGGWCLYAFKQGDSYSKNNFFIFSLLVASFCSPIVKLFFMSMIVVLGIQTGQQSVLMNYEVSYTFLFFSFLASFFLLFGQLLDGHWKKAVLLSSVVIIFASFFKPFHLYQNNLNASKKSLISIATRMQIYSKNKIIPAKQDVSLEAKKKFGVILAPLVRFHPVTSYKDMFSVDIKNIFSHARPMYSDQSYDKHKSRIQTLMRRLNLDWRYKAASYNGAKQFIITSLDYNDKVTRLGDDDFVTKDLKVTMPLESGSVIRSKVDDKSGVIYIFLNDKQVGTYTLSDIIYQHVPEKIEENMFQAQAQPKDMEKTIDISGHRIRIKISRIVGRKGSTSFSLQQVSGKIYIKVL